ncbi:hypothetical protein HK105_206980 [Polyrhizophydium stewartii]|uniref:BTB domain-containing protein n=1 Tax=Polyrhizophydium stewartii TaxID=2732419 RepID=A0ABR4N1Y4_9FUNG
MSSSADADADAAAAAAAGGAVTLDVGGRLFATTRATLAAARGSLLARLFDPARAAPALAADARGHYFLDRNPDAFAPVLDFLRARGGGPVLRPPALPRALLERELRFLGIAAPIADDPDAAALQPHPARGLLPAHSAADGSPPLHPQQQHQQQLQLQHLQQQQHPQQQPPVHHHDDGDDGAQTVTAAQAAAAGLPPPGRPSLLPTNTTTVSPANVTTPAAAFKSLTDNWLSFAARRQGFEDSWATSMACRSAPILARAMQAGLLRFTVFIDPNGAFKGVPSQLNASEVDRLFWQDFAASFAAAPPGSAQDFSQSFREHFNVTLTASYPTQTRLPGHVMAVVGAEGKLGQETEAVSWVVFRVKTVRSEQRLLPYVDRTDTDGIVESTVGLVLLLGWELHFNMPETLTASKVQERVKSVVHGVMRNEDVLMSLFLLN